MSELLWRCDVRHSSVVDDLARRALEKVHHLNLGVYKVLHKLKELVEVHSLLRVQLEEVLQEAVHLDSVVSRETVVDAGWELLDVVDVPAHSLKGYGILLVLEDLWNVLELLQEGRREVGVLERGRRGGW